MSPFAIFVLFSPNGPVTSAQLERPHAPPYYYFMRVLLVYCSFFNRQQSEPFENKLFYFMPNAEKNDDKQL